MEWISVKDMLPADETEVLVSDGMTVWIGEHYKKHVVKWSIVYDGSIRMDSRKITHWMPLPKPPQT